MLQIFLELIDRTVSLLEKKNQRAKTSVTNLVEPIYKELKTIHLDYMDFFNKALLKFEGSESNARNILREVLSDLKMDRVRLQGIRDEVFVLSEKLKKANFEHEVIQFFVSVHEYFPTEKMDYGPPPKYSSAATGLIGDLVQLEYRRPLIRVQGKLVPGEHDPSVFREKSMVFIKMYIDIKTRQWKEVCEKYASVKVMEVNKL